MNYLYVLISLRRLFRLKIGISRHPLQRWKRIGKSEPNVPIFVFPLLFAAKWELWLKRRYSHLRAKDMRDSGKTEWFYFWLPIRPILWALLFVAIEWGALIFLILAI